jgi:hypothetical protein
MNWSTRQQDGVEIWTAKSGTRVYEILKWPKGYVVLYGSDQHLRRIGPYHSSLALAKSYVEGEGGGAGKRNPSTDEEHLKMTCMVVGGAAVLGLVGYLIWKSQQTPATVATTQPPGVIGSGGSTVPLPANQPTGPQGS